MAISRDQKWNDWRWQMRNRIRSAEELRRYIPNLPVADGTLPAAEKFPMAVSPYYASLIREPFDTDPVLKMILPNWQELVDPPHLMDDPLGEDEDMPVPGLVHRYQDRALLIATTVCAAYCRHCTRKRVAGHRETAISSLRLNQVCEYLREHPEISDVIVSGGDPFTMDTEALDRVLTAVRAIPSVQIIRVGTRVPVVMPMRVTDELVQMLRRHNPVYVNTHFNHPSELTNEAKEALARMADAGIPLGNQTVLLKGINDDPVVLEELFRALVRNRVRPYYLFQCDLVRGVEHFRTPLTRGIEIMEYLRGRLSGLAIPTFVVDSPHGGGKVPVQPNYVVSMGASNTVLRNYEGVMVSYPEPGAGLPVAYGRTHANPGVWDLAAGLHTSIKPEHTARHARRRQRSESPARVGAHQP